MENDKDNCPLCGIQLDDNHWAPVSFPGIDKEICINCDQNIGLMFSNFEEKPSADGGYIIPDNSDRLELVTGRSYLKNRLIFYQYILKKRQSEDKTANVIKELKDEIDKITLAIKERNA
jgi:hypothetical protein